MTKDLHVSVDIEACGEVLLSIGACVFDHRSGEAGATFYGVPNVTDQLRAGLKMDGDAFGWLLKQDDACRAALAESEPAAVVLSNWHAWMARWGKPWVWAYPTSFDLPVIARAYAAFEMRPPWQWTKTLDGRTLWRLACQMDPSLEKIEKDANPSPHHALEDAKEQAKWFARYLVPILGEAARAVGETPE